MLKIKYVFAFAGIFAINALYAMEEDVHKVIDHVVRHETKKEVFMKQYIKYFLNLSHGNVEKTNKLEILIVKKFIIQVNSLR